MGRRRRRPRRGRGRRRAGRARAGAAGWAGSAGRAACCWAGSGVAGRTRAVLGRAILPSSRTAPKTALARPSLRGAAGSAGWTGTTGWTGTAGWTRHGGLDRQRGLGGGGGDGGHRDGLLAGGGEAHEAGVAVGSVAAGGDLVAGVALDRLDRSVGFDGADDADVVEHPVALPVEHHQVADLGWAFAVGDVAVGLLRPVLEGGDIADARAVGADGDARLGGHPGGEVGAPGPHPGALGGGAVLGDAGGVVGGGLHHPARELGLGDRDDVGAPPGGAGLQLVGEGAGARGGLLGGRLQGLLGGGLQGLLLGGVGCGGQDAGGVGAGDLALVADRPEDGAGAALAARRRRLGGLDRHPGWTGTRAGPARRAGPAARAGRRRRGRRASRRPAGRGRRGARGRRSRRVRSCGRRSCRRRCPRSSRSIRRV